MLQRPSLTEKLKLCIGQSRDFLLTNGETIPAGVESVNDMSETVKYLYGDALRRLKELQEKNMPTEEFLKNESNYETLSIEEIKDILNVQ